VTFVEDLEEKRHALVTMIRKNESNPGKVISEQIIGETLRSVGIGRIDIDLMTGKRSDSAEITL
jgi:hypothetical protein